MQLKTAVANGKNVSYTYNNDGIRTSKTVGGVTTNYFLDGSTILAQRTGNDVLWFLYDSDGTRVGFTYNGTTYYYMTNAQGDVTGIVDSNDKVVVEYNYDAWGKLLSTTGSMADTIGKLNPFLYRGYYFDAETGLYYLNSRYYDAQTGRFINEDGQFNPHTGMTGNNLFAYCNNNSTNLKDSDGNVSTADDGSGRWVTYTNGRKYEGGGHASSKVKYQTSKLTNAASAFGTNALQGTSDALLGRAIEKLPDIERNTTRVGPGVGIVVEQSREIKSVAALKSVSRVSGVIAAGSYVWDVASDATKYQGEDFCKAATVSTAVFATGVITGLLLSGVGAPIGITLLVGITVGTITGYVGDSAKKQWIGY